MCPRCKTPALKPSVESETTAAVTEEIEAQHSQETAVEAAATGGAGPATSTLIEFPGVSRISRPQWRKELSERVREIQERRAREQVREPEEAILRQADRPAVAETTVAPQLGLVPQPDAPAVNPIVVAALKRLERARQPLPPVQRPRASGGRGAAAAAARIAHEHYDAEALPIKAEAVTVKAQPAVVAPAPVPVEPAQAEELPQPKTPEPQRERPLVIVPPPAPPKVTAPEVIAATMSNPRPAKFAAEKIEEPALEIIEEADPSGATVAEFYDDRAPILARIAGSLIDLLVIAFASSPFAAIIELTNGNWSDWRVLASMGGIILIVMFLYLTAATALAGRTWGMSLFSLRPVDAETSLPPTTKQAVGRAILYMLSLSTLGLGILYAIFDVEGRAAHDHLSGTVVVKD